ncbi:MAG: hypothetical protein DYG88_07340 [Chloroflexi bacterium CFX4]|nr:hypothetical protein [Chloroflexi bacterium CFX4]MDL1921973.1 hypothetical protein [Chloroflexi bacterium CFX3]
MTNHEPDFGKLCNDESETTEFALPPPELPENIQRAIGYMQMLIEALEEHGDSPQLMHHLTPGQFIVLNQVLEESAFEEAHNA